MTMAPPVESSTMTTSSLPLVVATTLAFFASIGSSPSSGRGRLRLGAPSDASTAGLPFCSLVPLDSADTSFLGLRGISGFLSATKPWIGLSVRGSLLCGC